VPDPISPTAVVRVAHGSFDPDRFEEVREMSLATSRYLIPAIKKLPGLISYYAGASPNGSVVNVSFWDSDEHAQQMSQLNEMIVKARQEGETAGITSFDQVDYPIDWTI
jgi:hypothetical protein